MTPKTHILSFALSLSLAGIWLATFTGASLLVLLPESTFQHTGNIGWLAWYIPTALLTAIFLGKIAGKAEMSSKACRPVIHY